MKLYFELTLEEPMLGTNPADREVFATYIASKAPDKEKMAEEISDAEHAKMEETGTTVFLRDEKGQPFIYDYVVKGLLKDATKALKNAGAAEGELAARIEAIDEKAFTAYKTKIDMHIFPMPRRLTLHLPPGGEITHCERPLRAETAQGPRVALARSEQVPIGTKIRVSFTVLDKKLVDLIRAALEYGSLRGLGAWRNSGMGRFSHKELTAEAFAQPVAWE